MNQPSSVPSTLEQWWHIARHSSDVNRLIVLYLETHYRKAAFMTSAELAKEVGVSQASISRFASLLGFLGYTDWNKAMQQLIRQELSATERLWFAYHPQSDEGDRVVQSEQHNLEQLLRITNSTAFSALATQMATARQVIFVSARASATLMPYAHYFLSKVRPQVYQAHPGDTLWEHLPIAEVDRELIVVLGFPRYPRILVEWLQEVRKQPFTIAVITDHEASPLARYADITLAVPVATASLFDSYAAPMTAINLLIREVAQQTATQSQNRLQALEYIDQTKQTYYTEP